MTEELKPCPFCGSKRLEKDWSVNVDLHGHEHQDALIECLDCNARIFISGYTDNPAEGFPCSCCHDVGAEAVRRWNQRQEVEG